MRTFAHILFILAAIALNLVGCARHEIHRSTPNLEWVD
jgi:hypothetical protein